MSDFESTIALADAHIQDGLVIFFNWIYKCVESGIKEDRQQLLQNVQVSSLWLYIGIIFEDDRNGLPSIAWICGWSKVQTIIKPPR